MDRISTCHSVLQKRWNTATSDVDQAYLAQLNDGKSRYGKPLDELCELLASAAFRRDVQVPAEMLDTG